MVFTAILCHGCEPPQLTLEFVLPPNYHGYIYVVHDLSRSEELVEQQGKIRIIVPPESAFFL